MLSSGFLMVKDQKAGARLIRNTHTVEVVLGLAVVLLVEAEVEVVELLDGKTSQNGSHMENIL